MMTARVQTTYFPAVPHQLGCAALLQSQLLGQLGGGVFAQQSV
jgi:hypothetical protein